MKVFFLIFLILTCKVNSPKNEFIEYPDDETFKVISFGNFIRTAQVENFKNKESILTQSQNFSSSIFFVKEEFKLEQDSLFIRNLYLLSGKGKVIIDKKPFELNENDYFAIPKVSELVIKPELNKIMKILVFKVRE